MKYQSVGLHVCLNIDSAQVFQWVFQNFMNSYYQKWTIALQKFTEECLIFAIFFLNNIPLDTKAYMYTIEKF